MEERASVYTYLWIFSLLICCSLSFSLSLSLCSLFLYLSFILSLYRYLLFLSPLLSLSSLSLLCVLSISLSFSSLSHVHIYRERESSWKSFRFWRAFGSKLPNQTTPCVRAFLEPQEWQRLAYPQNLGKALLAWRELVQHPASALHCGLLSCFHLTQPTFLTLFKDSLRTRKAFP